MHAQKVRTLMTSIHMLKEQLSIAKAASKEHRRCRALGTQAHACNGSARCLCVLLSRPSRIFCAQVRADPAASRRRAGPGGCGRRPAAGEALDRGHGDCVGRYCTSQRNSCRPALEGATQRLPGVKFSLPLLHPPPTCRAGSGGAVGAGRRRGERAHHQAHVRRAEALPSQDARGAPA